MGATFFLVVLCMGALSLLAIGLAIVSIILLAIRAKRKRHGEPITRRYTVLPIVFLILTVLFALPPVFTISYTRSNTAELENHIDYGETVIAAEDGTFSLNKTIYYPVEICSLTDLAERSEPVANYFNSISGFLPMRIYFGVIGVHGEPVYSVKNEIGFDLLSAAGSLFCAEKDVDALASFCNSYDSWETFVLIGRHWDVSDTETLISAEVFDQMVQWRDGVHEVDTEEIYGDAVTLCAISPDGSLSCPIADFCLTENGEWTLQYIVWNETGPGQFSTEQIPKQWLKDLLPALEQLAGYSLYN